MASAFETLDTVVKFGTPRWPDGRQARWVLWPVWVRRVAAPARPSDELGPFERAILGCARARISDAEHMEGLLKIDRKLVKIIQQNLMQQGALDDQGGITSAGLDAINVGELEPAAINVIHIFQCGVSGLVLPRVTQQLEFAEVVRTGTRWSIELGSAAESRKSHCLAIMPPILQEPATPDAMEVLMAVRRHFADLRAAGVGDVATYDTDDGYRPRPKALHRVNVIDARARPMFLATVAYSVDVEALDGSADWRIADPFGIGESRRLHDEAERLRRVDKRFDALLRGLFAKRATATAPGVGVNPTDVWQLAHAEVASHAPNLDRNWRGHQHLVTMEEALIWAGEATSQGQKRARLRNRAQAARAAMEAAFTSLRDQYPMDGLKARLRPPLDPAIIRGMLSRASAKCGLGHQLPRRFEAVKPGDLVSVVFYGNSSKLTALVMATAMTAEHDNRHPLHRLAKANPTLLTDLDRGLGVAGEAAHDAGSASPATGELDDLVQLVYRLVNHLVASTGPTVGALNRS